MAQWKDRELEQDLDTPSSNFCLMEAYLSQEPRCRKANMVRVRFNCSPSHSSIGYMIKYSSAERPTANSTLTPTAP